MILVISLLQYLLWEGRHEFNALLMDMHVYFFSSEARAS